MMGGTRTLVLNGIPRRVLWTVPILLALHNAEEALTMPRYLPLVRAHLPSALRPSAGLPTPAVLGVLAVATVLPLGLAAWADRQPSASAARWGIALVQVVVALNVAWHLAAALTVGGYAPGLLTAVLVNLPFSVYFIRRAAREGWPSPRALWSTVPAAVVIHGPGLLGLLALAHLLGGSGTV
jgi:Protein of unknown function with HXXEE motif